MKKDILSLALLVCSAMPTFAQGTENPVGRFSITPRLGVVLSNRTGAVNTNGDKPKWHTGYLGGLDVEYRATELVGVSLGAYYAQQGMRYPDCEYLEDAVTRKYTGYKNQHMDFNYIHVPLMARIYVAPKFAVMAGVQVGFACGDGKLTYEQTSITKETNGSATYGETTNQEVSYSSKTDVAIPVGFTYEYMNVVLDARYNIGLSKVGEGGWDGSKNKALMVSVGYRFTL